MKSEEWCTTDWTKSWTVECYTQACKRDGTKMLKFHSFHVQKSSSDFIFPTLSNSLVFSAFTGHNFHAQMPLYSLTLFSLLSLSLLTPTASRLPFKSNSGLIFPIPLVMNHSLGFQDSTWPHLHLSKSKSDFPYSSLLGSDSRLKHSQPSSLSLSLL